MAVAAQLVYRALDANGDPVSGAKLYFFDAGTSTQRDVFTSSALSTTITQPVVADANGWFQAIYIDGTAGNYKDRLHNASNVALRDDLDNISPPVQGTVPVSQGGTGATTASAARTALSVPSQAVHDALDTRVTSAETTISANIDTSVETLTWGTNVEIDHSSQSTFQCTLAGTTAFTITNLRNGGDLELLLIQDGTGSRAVTFSGDFVFAAGVLRIAQTGGATTLIRGKVIGGVVYCKVQESVPVLAAAFGKKYSGAVATATASAWTTLALDSGTLYDDGTVVSGATSNVFTLPAGEYRITAQQSIDNVGIFTLRLRDNGDTTNYGEGMAVVASEASRGNLATLDTMRFVLTAQESFVLQYYAGAAGSLGSNNSANGLDSLVTYIAVERYS